MTLSKEIFENVVNGLNKLEERGYKSLVLTGLNLKEASELQDKYLTNYNAKVDNSRSLKEEYLITVTKKSDF